MGMRLLQYRAGLAMGHRYSSLWMNGLASIRGSEHVNAPSLTRVTRLSEDATLSWRKFIGFNIMGHRLSLPPAWLAMLPRPTRGPPPLEDVSPPDGPAAAAS